MEDDVVVMSDGDVGCCEGDVASGVAQLPDGEEGLCGKLGNNVAMAGRGRETGNGKVSLMGGMQNGTQGGVHGDRGVG